jgi:hypothetical protein
MHGDGGGETYAYEGSFESAGLCLDCPFHESPDPIAVMKPML